MIDDEIAVDHELNDVMMDVSSLTPDAPELVHTNRAYRRQTPREYATELPTQESANDSTHWVPSNSQAARCRRHSCRCGLVVDNARKIWSGRRDSNPRPPVPQTGALPDCATPRRTRSL